MILPTMILPGGVPCLAQDRGGVVAVSLEFPVEALLAPVFFGRPRILVEIGACFFGGESRS